MDRAPVLQFAWLYGHYEYVRDGLNFSAHIQLLALPAPKLIFVESFARVRSLSLSGRLLRNVVDVFLVQWPTTHRGAVYRGLLV